MMTARFFAIFIALSALTACSGNEDFADLRSFMDQERARPKGSIEALPKFQAYEAFAYSASALRSPFQPPIKIDVAAQQKGAKNVKPDESRVRQFLEGFNIEIFEMVGTLANQGAVYALVRGAGGVHRVKAGDYLGRNHGRVISVDDAKIDVVEIVPDGEGGWLERPRSITLRERT